MFTAEQKSFPTAGDAQYGYQVLYHLYTGDVTQIQFVQLVVCVAVTVNILISPEKNTGFFRCQEKPQLPKKQITENMWEVLHLQL